MKNVVLLLMLFYFKSNAQDNNKTDDGLQTYRSYINKHIYYDSVIRKALRKKKYFFVNLQNRKRSDSVNFAMRMMAGELERFPGYSNLQFLDLHAKYYAELKSKADSIRKHSTDSSGKR